MLLEIFQNSQENICDSVFFWNEVAGLRPANIIFTEHLLATASREAKVSDEQN